MSIASFRLLLKSDRGRLSLEGSSGSYQQVLVLAMQILSAEDHVVLMVTLAGEPAGQVTKQDSLKNTCQCCKVFEAL